MYIVTNLKSTLTFDKKFDELGCYQISIQRKINFSLRKQLQNKIKTILKTVSENFIKATGFTAQSQSVTLVIAHLNILK